MNRLILFACLFCTLLMAACEYRDQRGQVSPSAAKPDQDSNAVVGSVALPSNTEERDADRMHGQRPAEPPILTAQPRLDGPVAPAGEKSLADHVPASPPMRLRKEVTAGRVMAPMSSIRPPSAPVERERYAEFDKNGIHLVAETPVSTFSIDVDTGAYAIVRRFLSQGSLPPTDAVRTEELINYFNYDYPRPRQGAEPFSIQTEVAPSPWNSNAHLVRVGVQGFARDTAQLPPANLVFLIDVSGSMNQPNKLPLLKSAFRLLVDQLDADDRVSMVVYAGASGVVLEPTAGDRRGQILAALDRLRAGGSTHGAAGIRLAYAMAEQARVEGGINRVILATDGDFNVGTVDHNDLMDLIERQRRKGISLTTLGFGGGNYNDHLMEQLADRGDGNYAYIDTINEARKVLVDELAATLETIAQDVKIQIEWNPTRVREYRLIGYENRLLRREDFNNDKVDAGDIGAGHSVTALYEITLADGRPGHVEPLRYGGARQVRDVHATELAHLRLRYKRPGERQSRLIEQIISNGDLNGRLADASADFRFAASVAGFAELLRGGRHAGRFGYDDVIGFAKSARGQDDFGYRGEFLRLVRLAQSLDRRS